jgi:hypothetical protein
MQPCGAKTGKQITTNGIFIKERVRAFCPLRNIIKDAFYTLLTS